MPPVPSHSIFALLYFCFICLAKKSLFLIGDSIDRNIVEEWCEYYGFVDGELERNFSANAANKSVWAETELKYFRTKGIHYLQLPCEHCVNNNGYSVSSMHLYGSAAHGPYFKGITNNRNDMLIDSVDRLKRGWELYVETFGLPSIVVFNTVQWDAQLFLETHDEIDPLHPIWKTSIDTFKNNVNSRIDELISYFDNRNVELFLRTGVWGKRGGEYLRQLNDIVRDIAVNRSIGLYDFDKDVWSSLRHDPTFEPHILRDSIHPARRFTAPAGEKILRKQYSRYLTLNGHPRMQPFTSIEYFRNTTVKLIQNMESGQIYFLEQQQAAGAEIRVQRWYNVHISSIHLLGLHEGDIMPVSASLIGSIPVGGVGPSLTGITTEGVMTTSGRLYIIDGQALRMRVVHDEVWFRLFNVSNVFRNVSDVWIDQIHIPHSDVPSIHKEGSLIRFHSDKLVYAVYNCTRMPINSFSVFVAHGFDFENVIVLKDRAVMDTLPLGEPLS